jgi:hypothetical protein
VKTRVCEENMPTPRAKAAFVWLKANNPFYADFLRLQYGILDTGGALNISSYDLFTQHFGIECAMFPHLYPTGEFTDTAILQHYRGKNLDDTNRIASIGLSWTKKITSSVRAYGEQKDLALFLYEKHIGMKYFHAHVRATELNVTADVLTRDSQGSAGYWDIVQDSLADLVRIMLVRCYDEQNHPKLYRHCRNLRGEVWQCAFPNLFLTIAPAEWKFPRPYFLDPYLNCLFAASYFMALHMYFLMRFVWRFLANRRGHKFFTVFEWVIVTSLTQICKFSVCR